MLEAEEHLQDEDFQGVAVAELQGVDEEGSAAAQGVVEAVLVAVVVVEALEVGAAVGAEDFVVHKSVFTGNSSNILFSSILFHSPVETLYGTHNTVLYYKIHTSRDGV